MDTTNYSEYENKKEEIKKEDKKALPKLLLLTIVSGICGAIFATLSIEAMENLKEHSGSDLVELFQEAQLSLATYAGFATFAFSVTLSIVGFVIFHHYRKIALQEDINDEEVHDRVDKGLNISLFLTSINTIFSWVFFGIAFYCIALKENSSIMNTLSLFFALIGFILQTVCTSINQQKVVNLEKELNPEKNGSVYDLQFHKKWMNSCDEAERFYIYKCAFASYKATQIACMILIVILALAGMIFPIGILPLISVCIIWGASAIAYSIMAMKVEKMPE